MNVSTEQSGRTAAVGADAPAPDAPAPHAAPRWYAPAVVVATVLAAVNALVDIGANSVARDEGFSISTSLRGWASFVRLSVHTETNAWLYATVLKAWSALGTGPGALRVPSALAFVVTVPLVAEIGRRLYGRRVAVIAAVLVALNGSLLMFAQQIRGYAFAVAAAMGAMLVFVMEVRRPTRATLVGWVALVIVTASCHVHSASVVLPQLASIFALPVAQRRWRRRLGAIAVVGVLLAPMAYAISTHEEGQGLFSLRLGVFRDVLYTFAGRGGIAGVVAFAVAGAALAVTLLRPRRAAPAPGEPDRFALWLLAAWITVPFTVMLLASLVQPMLIGRYLLFCVPAMALAAALLVDRLVARTGPRRALALAGAVLVVFGAVRGTVSWHVDSRTEHWDDVTAYVFEHARADDRLVVANDSIRLFFEYERTQRDPTPAGPAPGYPADPWGAYETGDQRYLSPTGTELAAVAAATERMWVVVGHRHVDSDVMAERLRALEPDFRIADHRTFDVEIDVYLYERVKP